MSALRDGLLVGREEQTKLLRGVVTQARGRRGRTVLVEGVPGIGKSALVRVADALASRAGLPTLWVSGVKGSANDETVLRRAEQSAEHGPVAIFFEDLHAANDEALALWRRLALITAHTPTLLIGTRRPVPQQPSVDRLRREAVESGGLVITLAELSSQHVAGVAAGMTRAAAGPELLTYLAAAGGNPQYVNELMHAAWDSGALRVEEGVAELGSPAAPVLPGPIESRLEFLRPRTLEVLHGAALLGDPFSVADLSLISAYTPVELVPVVDEALAAGLVEPAGLLLRFRHPALRNALYQATPAESRKALRRQTAWVLTATGAQPERVARHLLDGGSAVTEPWEADWLAEHAEALNRRDPAAAAELLERAVSGLDAEEPRRAEYEYLLAEAQFRRFRFDDAFRIALGNAARGGDPDRIGRNTWLAGYSLLRLRRLDDLLRTLDEAAARPEASPRWLARYEALRAVAYGSFDRLDEARETARGALAAGERIGDVMTIGYALHAQSVVAIAGDQDCAAAAELLDRATALVRDEPELIDLRVLMWMNRFTVGLEIGEPPEAMMDWARQMLATAEAANLSRLGRLRLHVGEVAAELGLWDEAVAQLERIAEREPAWRAKRYALLGQIAARRDEDERASRMFDAMRRAEADAADDGGEIESTAARMVVIGARALEHERAGDVRAAADLLATCLSLGPNHPVRYRLLPSLTRLALVVGDAALAKDAARVAETDARQEASVSRRRLTELWCRGLLDGDPSAIRAATELLRAAWLRPALGNALEDEAELHARAGDLRRAREALVEALEVYDELGAAWDARRATTRLRAHGVRVRATAGRRAASGPEALTPTERKVAELVREGCSNPDIAERLNLSRRTVESHVSRILTKLGASSRGEVRALLAPVDP